jgi:beta-glucosidase
MAHLIVKLPTLIFSFAALLVSPCRDVHAQASATAAPDPQIEALIARMSVEEKVGQLTLFSDFIRAGDKTANPKVRQMAAQTLLEQIRAGRVTGVFQGIGAKSAHDLQQVAVEQSRWGIPLLFAADVIHGLRTVFPIPLAEAGSFDPDLAQRTARAAAVEATASGLQWTFAPMVDVARDQRWGRVSEGAGEDVYLGSVLAAARVRGFQGSDLTAKDSMLATPKHFAAYGAVAAGLEYGAVDVSPQTLWETHLPPFKAAFDAGALTTMSAFNEVNGVPASANPYLLNTVLHDAWHFQGFVVSDYTADEELIAHGFATDPRDATRLAFLAGVDMSMQSGFYMKYLPSLVAGGEVPMQRLDEAVRRVLGVKKALGLFANPYAAMDPMREQHEVGTPAIVALAREAAQRSIVLLKNEGNLLPLRKSGQRIALIGPFGADRKNLFGPWTIFGVESRAVDLAQGLRAALQDRSQLTVVRGSGIEKPLSGGIAAAVAAAKQADVVLLALGESQDMSGEAQSRTQVVIPDAQQALAEAVAATHKPVVVLLRNGRALALRGAVRDAQAIVETWFLGSQTGNAIADVLFGDINPSARLAVSFPVDSGQEPYFYNHKSTGRPAMTGQPQQFKARYRSTANEALYPFGFGLGYSPLRYESITLSTARLPWNDTLTIRVRVANAGRRDASEVVQLYIHDKVASVTRPVRELKAFKICRIPAGGSVETTFSLSRTDLEFVSADLQRVVEPGSFDLWVGPSSTSGLHASFDLLDK